MQVRQVPPKHCFAHECGSSLLLFAIAKQHRRRSRTLRYEQLLETLKPWGLTAIPLTTRNVLCVLKEARPWHHEHLHSPRSETAFTQRSRTLRRVRRNGMGGSGGSVSTLSTVIAGDGPRPRGPCEGSVNRSLGRLA